MQRDCAARRSKRIRNSHGTSSRKPAAATGCLPPESPAESGMQQTFSARKRHRLYGSYENAPGGASNSYAVMITSAAEQEIRAATPPLRCVAAQAKMVTIMTSSHLAPAGERIIEPMIALARCSTLQRFIVAGFKSVEITHEMTRRGFEHVVHQQIAARQPGNMTSLWLIGGVVRSKTSSRCSIGW